MKQEGGRKIKSIERPLGKGRRTEFFVTGSGLVRIPAARANEIPKVIVEHHNLEAERARVLTYLRRGV